MKTITIILIGFCLQLNLQAQDSNNNEKIYIGVLQPNRTEITQEASKQLENTMKKLIAANGIAGDDPSNRFIMTAKVDILSKDIISGMPQRVSQRINFTFIIGDVIENKIFETLTITATGIGTNENKSFISAIRNIRPGNKELVAFLDKAKNEIITYYANRCTEIIQEAHKQAAAQQYDAAIHTLMLMPSVCNCADECQQLAIQLYKEKIENDAASLLNKAKAAWVKSPDASGASIAASFLTQIPGNTSSQPGVDALMKEINEKLRDDEKREWEFKMKKYNDRIEREKREYQARLEREKQNHQARMAQQQAENATRRQLIEACRQVGLEYAKNQPETITLNYNRVLLW